MLWNYLGQFDHIVAGSSVFQFAREPNGPWRGPSGPRRYPLEVLALIIDGRLEVEWTYSENVHHLRLSLASRPGSWSHCGS